MAVMKQTETFLKWERKLKDQTAKALIAARLLRLANGFTGDVAAELRVHFGPGYRIYFQKRGAEIVLLLCGGDKGTQDRDIVTAKRLAKDWNDEHD
jgi:putative addiction module killer protein